MTDVAATNSRLNTKIVDGNMMGVDSFALHTTLLLSKFMFRGIEECSRRKETTREINSLSADVMPSFASRS